MNIYLDKHEINLILDALESYQLDIEHGTDNGYKYPWDESDVENLTKYLESHTNDN